MLERRPIALRPSSASGLGLGRWQQHGEVRLREPWFLSLTKDSPQVVARNRGLRLSKAGLINKKLQ